MPGSSAVRSITASTSAPVADLQRRRGAMLLRQVGRQPGERAAAHAPPGQAAAASQQHIGGAVGDAFLVGGQHRQAVG